MEPRLNGIWPQTGLRPASKLDSVVEFGFECFREAYVVLAERRIKGVNSGVISLPDVAVEVESIQFLVAPCRLIAAQVL